MRELRRHENWVAHEIDSLVDTYCLGYKIYYIFSIDRTQEQYEEMINWCRENIGKNNFASTIVGNRKYHFTRRFLFRTKEDLLSFRLRWDDCDK